jgi:hypothetical protein
MGNSARAFFIGHPSPCVRSDQPHSKAHKALLQVNTARSNGMMSMWCKPHTNRMHRRAVSLVTPTIMLKAQATARDFYQGCDGR